MLLLLRKLVMESIKFCWENFSKKSMLLNRLTHKSMPKSPLSVWTERVRYCLIVKTKVVGCPTTYTSPVFAAYIPDKLMIRNHPHRFVLTLKECGSCMTHKLWEGIITFKAPIKTAADDKFRDIFPNFRLVGWFCCFPSQQLWSLRDGQFT